ncbi:MAG: tRNA preQ1(34) S-adenosylmethionine ribosyltransferase-isomerase QueA [Firmicutes bacterium]|nr:tRNA preQ1(34) S-adenosylmethionine ribosyltransferase-isomerase QueA [Bacillota bacterium]
MKLTDFDYDLPLELIAQHPADKREDSRMMVLDRNCGSIDHEHFYNILDHLNPGDLLIMNNSKVIPARLFGIKEPTGAKIEILLIKRIEGDVWEAMVKPGKRLKTGDVVNFSDEKLFKAQVIGDGQEGTRHIKFIYEGIFNELLDEFGKIPLPPYIDRDNEKEDKDRYQTVYCKYEGSVAAPTAGLHFTEEILKKLEEKGVETGFVTLHVGIGTFRPVKTETVEEHVMHFEEYSVDQETADRINKAKEEGRRVISVGTTSTRTLESAADADGKVIPGQRSTNLFIYPPVYKFKVVDGLLTNFHLPKSTLLMLISAFYDREKILEAYKTAVEQKYRFFSYGDCMLII